MLTHRWFCALKCRVPPSLIVMLVFMPAIVLSQKMVELSFPLMCELTVMEGQGMGQREGEPLKQQSWGTRGEMEPTHWKETRAPRCTVDFFSDPSHLFTRGNGDVTHFTLGGTMVAGRKQQVTRGGGRRRREKGRWEGGIVEGLEEPLCFIYHGYYVLAPPAWAQ